MLIRYEDINIGPRRLAVIEQANAIISEYEVMGIELTLRSLHYQFVSRDLYANTQQNYKNLGDILNAGRLAGLVSWHALEDVTRNLEVLPWWPSPRDGLEALEAQFRIDVWDRQPTRVEVWIEKDAGVGSIKGVCERNQVPYFACRGNVSTSELWRAGRRFRNHYSCGQDVTVLHIGDLDPSGWDMTRDNTRRLSLFAEQEVDVRRIALNIDQVRRYRPPPNPVKMTDSKRNGYIELFGTSCWELDALDPRVLANMIQTAIDDVRDPYLWDEALAEQQKGHDTLREFIDQL